MGYRAWGEDRYTYPTSNALRYSCDNAPSSPLTPPARESIQRGRSSLWWGLETTPQLPFRFASRQGSGRTSGAGTGAQPCAPTEREPSAVPRESPERAQPSLVGAWGTPPTPFPLCFPPGKRPDIWGGDGRTAVRPYGTGTGGGPAGESREGAALFGKGLGVPPTPFRSASRQGSGRTSGAGDGRTAVRPYEFGTGGRVKGGTRGLDSPAPLAAAIIILWPPYSSHR